MTDTEYEKMAREWLGNLPVGGSFFGAPSPQVSLAAPLAALLKRVADAAAKAAAEEERDGCVEACDEVRADR